MISPKILAKGEFAPEDIEVSYTEKSNLEITPEMAAQIDELWNKIVEDRAQKGLKIWNAITYRVNDFEILQNGKIRVEFTPIDFKTRECIIKLPGYFNWLNTRWRMGAYVCSFVRTSDDYYVFVVLSGRSLNERKHEMLGGIVGDTVEVRSGTDLYKVIYQEIEEEAAIQRKSITSCILKLIFLSPKTNVGFCFVVDVNQTKEEIERNYTKNGKDPDIKSLLFVPSSALEQQCQSMQDYKVFLYEELFR